ncbi:MAG: hypothetical protein SOI62_03645, partial [Lactobacillus sp.]
FYFLPVRAYKAQVTAWAFLTSQNSLEIFEKIAGLAAEKAMKRLSSRQFAKKITSAGGTA